MNGTTNSAQYQTVTITNFTDNQIAAVTQAYNSYVGYSLGDSLPIRDDWDLEEDLWNS